MKPGKYIFHSDYRKIGPNYIQIITEIVNTISKVSTFIPKIDVKNCIKIF